MVAEVFPDMVSMSRIQLSEYLSVCVQSGEELTLFEFAYPLGHTRTCFYQSNYSVSAKFSLFLAQGREYVE